MTETLLRAVRTPLLAIDVYAAIRMAWRIQVRTEPSRAQLLTILAQAWLETGNSGASYGFNLGGIKYTKGCGHDYYEIRTHETIPGKGDTILTAPFRSYASLEDAAEDYVHVLRTTFGFAWAALEAADVAAFAHALKQRHYYTTTEGEYAAGLQARYAALDASLGDETDPDLIERIGTIAVAASSDPESDPDAA